MRVSSESVELHPCSKDINSTIDKMVTNKYLRVMHLYPVNDLYGKRQLVSLEAGFLIENEENLHYANSSIAK